METADRRLAPQEKLVRHPQFAAYLAGRKVYPVNVEVSPSGVCNASCDACWFVRGDGPGTHRNVFLDKARCLKLLEECASLGVKSVTWTGGGEPSLHPAIGTLVRHARDLELAQGMFTNALAAPKYDPSLLSWIRVTMTDRPYREDVIASLRPAKTLGFAFNYAGAHEDDYLRSTLDLASRVGADYVQVRPALKFHGATVDVQPPGFTHPLLHVTGYKFEQARVPHGYARCEGYHFVPFVWEDGNVDVCAYMRLHDGYTLGSLYKDDFQAILDSAPPSVAVHANCQVACRLHEFNLLVTKSRRLEDVEFP